MKPGPARVGIFARVNDPIAQALKASIEARAAQARIFELATLALGAPVAFDNEEWLVDGDALSEFDAFFVRQIPAETSWLGSPGETATSETWWQRAQLSRERAHLAQSCVAHLELLGKRVLNPSASLPFDQKAYQLAALHRAGLPLPRTLVTNFPDAVRAFEADVGPLIFKPLGGGAETQVFDDAARERLTAPLPSPVIFQERVSGPDIRVTVVAGRIVSSVEIPTSHIDYRLGQDYRAGKQEYLPHALSNEGAAMALLAASTCQQVLSGVDLKLSKEGYVVIEANSGPVYLDIERKTGAPITDALVDALGVRSHR